MMDDRMGNVNSNSVARRSSRAREVGQYTEPGEISQEVKAYLDQTHPLRQKREMEQRRDTYMGVSSEREDVEEVREARMQRVGTEIEGIKRQPQQEGEATRYVSRRARNSASEPTEITYNTNKRPMAEEEFGERVPYVSVMPPRKKSRNMEEANGQNAGQQKRPPRRPEEGPRFDGTSPNRRPAPPVRDPERTKQEHLDRLYGDYDDEDDYERRAGKIAIIVGIVAVLLIAFLIYRNISVSAKLEEAQAQVTQTTEITAKYEELQLENMRLQEQITDLQTPSIEVPTESESGEPEAGGSSSASTSTVGGDSYTVVSGDSMWGIATKVYGDGTRFNEILTANGLSESDSLSVGQVLTIPR